MSTQQPITLDDVVINSELASRPSRLPDHAAENKALCALAQTMADSPQMILQKLVETALRLCRADTAGISLLEKHNGVEVFRWEAVAGVYADRLNNTMPRDASPCSVAIDRDATQLMYMAERFFPALTAEPPVVEALLIPLHVEHRPVGTVWIVAHDDARKFDREDERIIRTLAEFASAGWQIGKARATAEAAAQTEQRRAVEETAVNQALRLQIGERRHAEEKLQLFSNELESRVAARTEDLLRVNADLSRTLDEGNRLQEQLRQSQKMESIGTLAGGLAHDFNNLLNIVQGYISAIMRHPTDAEEVIRDTEIIRETVDKGAALSRQLLTMARKAEAKFDPIEINGLLRRLTNLLSETFPKTVTITLDLDARIPNIMADANQINQALLNLCVNARDAMADGGNLRLRTQVIAGADMRARFHEVKSERYVCISVADTGAGMDEKVRSRVFEPFFTTKDPGQGTGLGLSVTYGIVNNHHGFIEVSSEAGHGSTFHIYLPIPKNQVALADPTKPFERTQISARARHTETLLFVEDEVRQLHLMKGFLEGEGFTVLTARDGAEAVEMHLRHKDEIAVVILDLGLAKLNGWEAFQRMKKANPKVKGILASGYLPAETELQITQGYLCDVLSKPYQLDVLLNKIEDAIGTRKDSPGSRSTRYSSLFKHLKPPSVPTV